MTTTRRPRFQRADHPPTMRFQSRDGDILQLIHDFDGVIARRHVKELYWPDRSQQVMQVRLSKLYHNGFINWPSQVQRKLHPIPEPILWLGWRGILYLAGLQGVQVPFPSRLNENQLRRLQRNLRKNDIRWLREPNWSYLHHDLSMADFGLAIRRSLTDHPILELEEWFPESVFRANPDKVSFTYTGNNGKFYQKKRGVIPDGVFVLLNTERRFLKKPARVRFLIEMDMATHDTPSFGIEKAAAGGAYIRSTGYKNRFSANSGRWLIVTTSTRRMENLIRQTLNKTQQDAHLFYFTTMDQIYTKNILTDPIWWQAGKEKPLSLPIT